MRIGRAWAEGVFSGKRLAEAARAAMRAGRAGDPGGELFPIRQEDASPVAEATRSGRFVVHYQPKIDMRTGALTGAEALVRAVAEDGSVVPPSRFIELLEEDDELRAQVENDVRAFLGMPSIEEAEESAMAPMGEPQPLEVEPRNSLVDNAFGAAEGSQAFDGEDDDNNFGNE